MTQLMDVLALLRTKRFVDLTHAFSPGIPHAADFPDETIQTVFDYDPGIGTNGYGFLTHRYSHVGQWGTHVDPPAHFIRGGRTVDQILVDEMILPLVVFDVTQHVEANPDYEISMEDVLNWQSKYGQVPRGAFAVMKTGWSKRWPDQQLMRNADDSGVAHFPGWGLPVLKYLYEDCLITASGHETTDTDPGVLVSINAFPAETYVLAANGFQIELLANLQDIPEYGGIAVVTFPKPLGGSGYPARVFAIIP
jgi:kynurenine formamidase